MQSKRRLKPCPFCGGKAKRRDELTSGVEGVVACEECGAATFASVWNQRYTGEIGGYKVKTELGRKLLRARSEYERLTKRRKARNAK